LTMACRGNCRQFCLWIEGMAYHRKYAISKDMCPALPDCFVETVMGEMVPGAIRQLRGPSGAHVHEFADRWEVHRDLADADMDPVGHLVKDAPEYLATIGAVILAGLVLGKSGCRDKRVQAALAGGLAGVFTLLAGKMAKLLDEGN